MITRFFNTAKPIHFVIIAAFTLIVFVLARFNNIDESFNLSTLTEELGKFAIVLSSLLVFDFLVRKNKLSRKNGYEILILSLLFAILPLTMFISQFLLANFFVLLALRRIISLRSNLNVKKKLFDAAFWIAIASLFHFWAILFFVLIITALILYSIADIKNWVVPFMGIIVVVLVSISYSLITSDDLGGLSNYVDQVSFNFTNYSDKGILFSISVLIALSFWALIIFVANLKKRQKAYRPSNILVLTAFLIGITIIVISPNKNGSEFLFAFPALAIIISNYLEAIKERWVAELYVWILIVTPVIALML